MFILRFMRILLGYVVFEGSGGFPERFLNLCALEHIPLWDVQFHGDKIEGKTTVKGYLGIRKAVHRAGLSVHILDKRGLPFLTHQNRKRFGLLLGAVLSMLLLCFLSSMIWSVRVEGNENIPEETILEVAEELGIKVGARKSTIKASQKAEELMEHFDELSFAAVNLDFSKAIIEVRERTQKPEILDTVTPSNIVAAENGILLRLDVYSGTPCIPEGSAVLKGDLLISGVIENKDSSERLKGAGGHAYARIERPFTITADAEKLYACTEVTLRRSLLFFGLHLPLGKSVGESPYKTERYLQNKNTVLPIGIQEEHHTDFSSAYTFANAATAKRYAAAQYADFYKTTAESTEKVLSENIEFIESDSAPKITGVLICEKDIGKKQEIFVEKN